MVSRIRQRFRPLDSGSFFSLFIFITIIFIVPFSDGFPLLSHHPATRSFLSDRASQTTVTGKMRREVVIMNDKKKTEPSFVEVAQAYWKAFQEEYAKEREKQVSVYVDITYIVT